MPPAINLDDSGDTTTSSISIKVDATDSDSGIKAYYYSSDGGASWSSPQTHGVYIFLGSLKFYRLQYLCSSRR